MTIGHEGTRPSTIEMKVDPSASAAARPPVGMTKGERHPPLQTAGNKGDYLLAFLGKYGIMLCLLGRNIFGEDFFGN